MNAGANINKQNRAGETPLMKACFFVEKNCIEWMLTNIQNLDLTLRDTVDFLF